MDTFHIFLLALCIIYFVIAITVTRKSKLKREFSNGFLLTLITFFIAIVPSQKMTLSYMLLALTIYHVYLAFKKFDE